jgi:hypothetical protein
MIAPETKGANAPEVTRITSLDADRSVAHVSIPPFKISSIFITGISTGTPVVAWPRTARGFKIVEVDEPERSRIEAAILEALPPC